MEKYFLDGIGVHFSLEFPGGFIKNYTLKQL
jgi:hypothetical protein